MNSDSRVPNLAECVNHYQNNNNTEQSSTGNNSWEIGNSVEQFEGGGDPGRINGKKSAKDDTGGWSYGNYQIATKTGTMDEYLKQSKYKDEFKGLKPGTPVFNSKWKEIAKRDPNGFKKDQKEFIRKSHYEPQVKKLKQNSYDMTSRGHAVQDMVLSTSVQYRDKTLGIFSSALKGKDVNKMTDAEIIKAVQKQKRIRAYTKEGKGTIKGMVNRISKEEQVLLKKYQQENNH